LFFSNYNFYYCIDVNVEIPIATPNREYPVVALLGLGDDVKLGLLPNSHNVVMFEKQDKLQAAIEFKIKLGEIILINPLFVHYGCAYSVNEKSLRAHYYFDNPTMKQKRKSSTYERRTFFFNVAVKPVLTTLPKGKRKSLRGENKKRKPNI
jgi:hypothetical protein